MLRMEELLNLLQPVFPPASESRRFVSLRSVEKRLVIEKKKGPDGRVSE